MGFRVGVGVGVRGRGRGVVRGREAAACSFDLKRPMCTTDPSLVARTSKAVTPRRAKKIEATQR